MIRIEVYKLITVKLVIIHFIVKIAKQIEKNDETRSKFVTADEALNDIVCIGREAMQMRLRLNTTSGLEALLAHQLFSLFASHFVPYSTSTEVLTFRCAIAWPTCAFRGSLSRGTRSVTSITFKTLTLVAKHQHTDLKRKITRSGFHVDVDHLSRLRPVGDKRLI